MWSNKMKWKSFEHKKYKPEFEEWECINDQMYRTH